MEFGFENCVGTLARKSIKSSKDSDSSLVYSLIRRGFFLEISGSNWGARLIGEVYRDRK